MVSRENQAISCGIFHEKRPEVGDLKGLYDRHPETRGVFRAAGQVLNRSALDFTEEELTQSYYAHIATFIQNEAHRSRRAFRGFMPQYYAGYGVAEYNAFVASGALSFEDALKLAGARGDGIDLARAEQQVGQLILSCSSGAFDDRLLNGFKNDYGLYVSAYNAEGEIVLGGTEVNIQRAKKWFYAKKFTDQGLTLTQEPAAIGALNTPLMRSAELFLKGALSGVTISKPEPPVIGNTSAQPIIEPQGVRDEITNQPTMTNLWWQSREYLLSIGVTSFWQFGDQEILSAPFPKSMTILKVLGGVVGAVGTGAAVIYLIRRHNQSPKP